MRFLQSFKQFSNIVLTNFRLLFNINFSITIVLYTYFIFSLFFLFIISIRHKEPQKLQAGGNMSLSCYYSTLSKNKQCW